MIHPQLRRPFLIISCGKTKGSHPAPAAELYIGNLFSASRRHAQERGLPWAILSALHGLVRPEARIAPYDLSMSDRLLRGEAELAQYKAQLRQQLTELLEGSGCDGVEIHAGYDYARMLRPLSPLPVVEPLAGLGMGERLGWYKQPPLFGYGGGGR